MKIALLSAFYPYRGGIAQFSAKLYRELEKQHELNAITFKRQYPDFLFPGETQFVDKSDSADKINAVRLIDSLNPLTYWKTARSIKEFNPDVVISQYWMTFFGPSFGSIHRRLKGTKRISILHNVIPHEKRFFDSFANKFFLKQNDGFVVMSDKVLKDLLSIVPDAKYLQIEHPVYNQFGTKKKRDVVLTELGLPKNKKYLLFFGIIRDYKGLDLLVQSVKLLDIDIEVIVAGESYGSFQKYSDLMHLEGVESRIHLFNKYIPDNEVATFFSAADVCILPYKSATQSGITAIANHFELPIIATNVGGLKEGVRHNETGIIVEEPDHLQLAMAIKEYFSSGKEGLFQKNISDRNKQNSWSKFTQNVLEFADSIDVSL